MRIPLKSLDQAGMPNWANPDDSEEGRETKYFSMISARNIPKKGDGRYVTEMPFLFTYVHLALWNP